MELLDVGGFICKNFSIFLWSSTFHKTRPETSTYYLTLYLLVRIRSIVYAGKAG